MPGDDRPSLPTFEKLLAEHRVREAFAAALTILRAIEAARGRIDREMLGTFRPAGNEEETALVFATRFASAFGRLMTDPALVFSAAEYEQLLSHYRWIDLIFSLSGFRNSDPFLALLAKDLGAGRLAFEGANVLRLLALLSTNSNINIELEPLWKANRAAAAVAFLNYISSRYVFTPRAFALREQLLEWLPARLNEVKLGTLTLARLPEVYMHCSYAVTARKHAIKRPLIEQMRRALIESGVRESTAPLPPRGERATVVVVGEWLTPGHAIYRTHARAIAALRPRFHTVGVVYPYPPKPEIAALFDEIIDIPNGEFLASVHTLADRILAYRPAAIFYPSIGMIPHVIALASLRLAPVQCASYGHMATTMSPAIDHIIFPADFIGKRECFTENIVALPAEAMPFVRRQTVVARSHAEDGIVRVAIPASVMKLNPLFFDALTRIASCIRSRAQFHFFPLLATGLPHVYLTRIVRERLPEAVVHAETNHETYIAQLARCDLFLCPFPYGNTNSIVDAAQVGLPGVCLDGAEAHAHTDAALLARLGLPADLVASSVNAYVAAAARLIDEPAWRCHCREIVAKADLDAAFFTGKPELFATAIEGLVWPMQTGDDRLAASSFP
jgi:hypothetical protein